MSLAKRYSSPKDAKVALEKNSTPESGQQLTVSESDALCSPVSFERGSLLSTLSVKPSFNDSASRFSNEVNVAVLSVHELVEYTIPSFSIITVTLRQARATFGAQSKQVDVFLTTNGTIPDRVPFLIKVDKKCAVEVRLRQCLMKLCDFFFLCRCLNSTRLLMFHISAWLTIM